MNLADRIVLTLYTLIMLAISAAVVLVSLGMVGYHNLSIFMDLINGNWAFALGGVVMFLVSLHLLITGIGIGGGSLKLADGAGGKVTVSRRALEHYIEDLAEEIYGIHHTKVVIKLQEEAIGVRINATIEPGINIPEATKDVRDNIKESVKKAIGAEVREVELFVKQIKAKEE